MLLRKVQEMHDPPTWESTKSDSLTKETQADCLQMVIACDSVPLNVDLSSIAVGKKKITGANP